MAVDWNDLRFLLAIRREGSLGAAARALRVDASTVSRRLASLETSLGTQLAVRTPEGLTLSEAGELAAEAAGAMDQLVSELARRIGGEDARPAGIVRVSCTDAMAAFLAPRLTSLRAPDSPIQLHFLVSSAALDLVRREADLAVRFFRDPSPTLIARKIGSVGWSLYASPDYVARHDLGPPARCGVPDLIGHAIVNYRGPAGRSPGAEWLRQHTRDEDVVYTGDGVPTVLGAVRSGLGISTLPCFAVADEPNLVRLTHDVVAVSEAFAVIPPDHRRTARVRVVLDALAELFERERAFLSGA